MPTHYVVVHSVERFYHNFAGMPKSRTGWRGWGTVINQRLVVHHGYGCSLDFTHGVPKNKARSKRRRPQDLQ